MRSGKLIKTLFVFVAFGLLSAGCAGSSNQETVPIGAPSEETVVVGTPTPPELLFTPLPPKNQRTPIPTPRGKTPAAKTEPKAPPTSTPKPAATQPVPTATAVRSPRPSSAASPQATQAARELKITIRDNAIDPGSLTVETGRVILTVENRGTALHSLSIKGTGVDARTDRIESGRSSTIEIAFSQPGTYEISCPVDDHKQRGEAGTITVK